MTEGFSLATEIADYLVLKGVPFRDAHHITGQIVQHAIKDGKTLEEIPVDALRSFSDAIGEDIASVLNTKSAVSSKNCIGGTAFDQVNKQLQLIKERYKW